MSAPTPPSQLAHTLARLSRQAVELAATVHEITSGPVSAADAVLLPLDVALLRGSVRWLEQVIFEAERNGQFDGPSRRPPLPITEERRLGESRDQIEAAP